MALNFTFVQKNYKCDSPKCPPIHVFTLGHKHTSITFKKNYFLHLVIVFKL